MLATTFVPYFPGSRVGYRVDPLTGCWIWMGAIGSGGYGRVGILGTKRIAVAHRVYWERAHGSVPQGFELDHLCRVRCCVNPDHLEVVTRRINVRRGLKTKLTAAKVCEIKRRYAAGDGNTVTLGLEYGVGNDQISRIIRGDRRTWLD